MVGMVLLVKLDDCMRGSGTDVCLCATCSLHDENMFVLIINHCYVLTVYYASYSLSVQLPWGWVYAENRLSCEKLAYGLPHNVFRHGILFAPHTHAYIQYVHHRFQLVMVRIELDLTPSYTATART